LQLVVDGPAERTNPIGRDLQPLRMARGMLAPRSPTMIVMPPFVIRASRFVIAAPM
jgi:hypothetical protein